MAIENLVRDGPVHTFFSGKQNNVKSPLLDDMLLPSIVKFHAVSLRNRKFTGCLYLTLARNIMCLPVLYLGP